VDPSHEDTARRSTDRAARVGLVEFETFFGKGVQAWGLQHLRSITSKVGGAQIVYHNKQDVRSLGEKWARYGPGNRK